MPTTTPVDLSDFSLWRNGFPDDLFAELRRDNERTARGAGWARAKRVLQEVIAREVGEVRDVGWVKKIGDGLSRDIFAA